MTIFQLDIWGIHLGVRHLLTDSPLPLGQGRLSVFWKPRAVIVHPDLDTVHLRWVRARYPDLVIRTVIVLNVISSTIREQELIEINIVI